MSVLAAILSPLNALMNGVGSVLLGPLIRHAPGWLSNTIISAVIGIMMLFIFKYTSNQKAIEGVRNRIKANMLALKLFRDCFSVTAKIQMLLFSEAFKLLWHSLRPIAVMILPLSLLLAQMDLWYSHRPLQVGEKTLIAIALNDPSNPHMPEVALEPGPGAVITTGPTRIERKHEIYWEIEAQCEGYHPLVFNVGQHIIEKELAVGDGYMRISTERPPQSAAAMLIHPAEQPFDPAGDVRSIRVFYPSRSGWAGGDRWIFYFFICSMAAALVFKSKLNVKI